MVVIKVVVIVFKSGCKRKELCSRIIEGIIWLKFVINCYEIYMVILFFIID